MPVIEPSGQTFYTTWDQAALFYFGEELLSFLAGIPWKFVLGGGRSTRFFGAGWATASASPTFKTAMKNRKPNRYLRHRSYRKLLRLAGGFIDSLRHEADFARAISADPRAFRGDLIRAIRAQLRLRRGRRSDPRLDDAYQLLREGQSVATVLRSQIPAFDSLDTYTRYLAERGLRQAAARRKKRERADRRTNRHHEVTTTNPRQNRPRK